MHCHYFDAAKCLSCTLLKMPYAQQVNQKQQQAAALLEPFGNPAWLEPFTGPEQAYRTRIKMVVAGTAKQPTFGILDRQRRGIDLRGCAVIHPDLTRLFGLIQSLIRISRVRPYSVPQKTGELKQVHMTLNHAGQVMLRFVMRTQQGVHTIQPHLHGFLERAPQVVTITANLLPEHTALAEGAQEIHLAGEHTFPTTINGLTLQLRPQGFVQTNLTVAEGLYAQAAQWLAAEPPSSVWDLYCGVGGFAFTAARAGAHRVEGVEISPAAVEAGQEAARLHGLDNVNFQAADATSWVRDKPSPELVMVNPPRRGLGQDLPDWLDGSQAQRMIYSSCNPHSLAKDLNAMPSWRVREARLFDMFPQTPHMEVITMLERKN